MRLNINVFTGYYLLHSLSSKAFNSQLQTIFLPYDEEWPLEGIRSLPLIVTPSTVKKSYALYTQGSLLSGIAPALKFGLKHK